MAQFGVTPSGAGGRLGSCSWRSTTAWRSGAQELGALDLAAALAVAHTLTTLRAAPTLLASRHVPLTDERSLAKIFDRFARWQGLRMCLQVLTFAASLWAAAGALRR